MRTSTQITKRSLVVRVRGRSVWHAVSVPMEILVQWVKQHHPDRVAAAKARMVDAPPGYEVQPCIQCSGTGRSA